MERVNLIYCDMNKAWIAKDPGVIEKDLSMYPVKEVEHEWTRYEVSLREAHKRREILEEHIRTIAMNVGIDNSDLLYGDTVKLLKIMSTKVNELKVSKSKVPAPTEQQLLEAQALSELRVKKQPRKL